MKILFISALYPPQTRGGGELSTHYIAQGLINRGHEVRVITGGDEPSQYEVGGVPVKRLALNLAAKPLLEARYSRKMARRIAGAVPGMDEYDVVHAHDFRSALALSELGAKGAAVTVRDYAQICGSPNNLLADDTVCPGCSSLLVAMKNKAVAEAPLYRKPFRTWQYWWNVDYRKAAFRKFARHVYISWAQLEETRRQQNMDGIEARVIYNPVQEDFLRQPAERAVDETILYVGTLGSYKGVKLLLEAFREVARTNTNAHLKIIGDGEKKREYEQFAAQCGLQYRVKFAGRVEWDRMRQEYDSATVIAAPHIWIEPFGRTVAEGMARGKIVVSANAGGPAELIKDGVTGLLFERGSKEALAQRLSDALRMKELDRREMGRAAREWAATYLNQNEIARQYEEVYESIVMKLSRMTTSQ